MSKISKKNVVADTKAIKRAAARKAKTLVAIDKIVEKAIDQVVKEVEKAEAVPVAKVVKKVGRTKK